MTMTTPRSEVAAALFITRDPVLAEAVRLLAPTVQGVSYDEPDQDEADRIGEGAGLLVLVPSLAEVLNGDAVAGYELVTRNLDDAGVWARAAALCVGHVVVLPDGAGWLRNRVSAHLADI